MSQCEACNVAEKRKKFRPQKFLTEKKKRSQLTWLAKSSFLFFPPSVWQKVMWAWSSRSSYIFTVQDSGFVVSGFDCLDVGQNDGDHRTVFTVFTVLEESGSSLFLLLISD